MAQHPQQPPSAESLRTMRRDTVSASRRARARRMLEPPAAPAAVSLQVLVDWSVHYEVAPDLPSALEVQALEHLIGVAQERLQQLQEGG